MYNMAKISLLISTILLYNLISESSAECCYSDRGWTPFQILSEGSRGMCEDGTKSTPCCSFYSCGMDCCGCGEGSCRTKYTPPIEYCEAVFLGDQDHHDHNIELTCINPDGNPVHNCQEKRQPSGTTIKYKCARGYYMSTFLTSSKTLECVGQTWNNYAEFSRTTCKPLSPVICGKTYNDGSGIIQSRGYPYSYAHNIACSWRISSGQNLTLLVEDYSMEAGSDGCYDYLEIRDGSNANSTLIERLCRDGDSRLPYSIRSSGNSLFFNFVTDSTVSKRGFQISWTGVKFIERKLILPMKTENGISLESVRNTLKRRLIEEYGGFSMSEIHGEWLSPTDNRIVPEGSWQFVIAMVDSTENFDKFNRIVTWMRKASGQETIYTAEYRVDVRFQHT